MISIDCSHSKSKGGRTRVAGNGVVEADATKVGGSGTDTAKDGHASASGHPNEERSRLVELPVGSAGTDMDAGDVGAGGVGAGGVGAGGVGAGGVGAGGVGAGGVGAGGVGAGGVGAGGVGAGVEQEAAAVGASSAHEGGASVSVASKLRRLYTNKTYWLLTASFFCCGITTTGFLESHLVALAVHVGRYQLVLLLRVESGTGGMDE